MKPNLLKLIMDVSKRSLYILIVQIVSMQFVLANEILGQSLAKVEVSISTKNASLEEIISLIENQTDFVFVAEGPVVNSNTRIDLKLKKTNLKYVLEELSREFRYNFKRINNNIYVRKRGKDEHNLEERTEHQLWDRDISGKVTDENGNELPGVNVLVKDTNIGTITDLNGNYVLNVPDDATILVFSYVGYITEEVDIAGRSTVDFVLTPDIETLSEVVVIGYGTQKRKEVSGAVAQVDGKELTRAPISTLTNALSGRLPGLTIDQRSSEPGRESTAILVRGQGTIGNNAALIVIDGVANVDGLARLDPNDIESVTVLKDASAAIYGAQAANGVILVTTKRGESGKPSFNYSFNAGFNSPVSLVDVADGLEYATYINRVDFYNTDWDPGYIPLYSDADIENIRTGTTPTTEWHKSSYKDFFSQTSHNFSVRGGSEKVRYFLSARYFQQGTIFVGDNNGENKQYNIRSNTDFTFGKGLDIGLNIALRQQDVETSAARGPGILVNGVKSSPLIEKFVNGDTRYPATGRSFQNPVAMLRAGGYLRNERRNQSAMLKFNYEIPKINGLAIGGFFSVGMDTDMAKNFLKPWLYYVENASDPNGIPEASTSGISQLDQRHDRTRILTSNFRTTYKKTIGEKHNLDALLQVEKQEIRTDWFSAGNDNFLSTASDFLGSGSDAREDSYVNGAASELARIGYSGRLNYNYEGKYIAQFLFRYDGSERFAKGQRFGFFPGASLAWVISDEDFLNNSELVSNLKLRASWGQLGNDRIGAFNYLSRFRLGNSTVVDGATVPGIVETGSANPDVTWETTETINIGLEAAFFDNKLNLELDVFDMQTTGILTSPQLTLPQYTGITPPQQNIGRHQNRGFEVAASYRQQKGELSFSIGGNASYTRNKVKFFDEPPFDEAYQSQTGKAWGSPLQYRAIGVFRTQDELDNLPTRPGDRLGKVMIQDTNGDGEITLADRVRTKPGNHDFYYGITTQVTFRNFDLNMLWQGATGGLKTFQSFFSAGNNGLAIVAEESWGPDNFNGTWPTAPRDAHDTDFFRLKADYIRLKTLEIGYTLPENVVSTIGLNNVRVYASAYNLLTFSKILSKYGFTDPEQLNAEAQDFPTLKTINLGVNVSF
ncbi:SusC/RagA family TonB-linked outer membrane protein [Fulvivirgaceae bacterium BMA12]|uniref:SusC/RagA family TonB-linked outer membrane protein n=1 Tax=Agaribacillus aureus TaxID=3051825 RepID=A0ABT8LB47_9BACT|nr:SusC/RagA family TonB-linked outer membrane protein [Fulvivirgaceae bacterium BMA12]